MLLIQIALAGFRNYRYPSVFETAVPAVPMGHYSLSFERFVHVFIYSSGKAFSAARRMAMAMTTALPDGSAAERRGEGGERTLVG